MTYSEKIKLQTVHEGMHDILSFLQSIVKQSGIVEGFCIIHCPHTTAGLLITSFWDKSGHVDIMEELERVIPTRCDFHHQWDTATDASGHIKSAIVGTNITLIISEGKVVLGSSQSIYFAEFDGPRNREVLVKVISD